MYQNIPFWPWSSLLPCLLVEGAFEIIKHYLTEQQIKKHILKKKHFLYILVVFLTIYITILSALWISPYTIFSPLSS